MGKVYILIFLIFLTCSVGAQDFASLNFSNKVICSFKQGDNAGSNRSSISLVKCAIATFGLDAVLKKIKKNEGSLTITLRNGDSVNLSSAELTLCKASSGFKLMSEETIFDKATLLYAILAKRAVNNPDPNFVSCKDLVSALFFLHAQHNDLNVINLVPLLGLNFIEVKIFTEICYIKRVL